MNAFSTAFTRGLPHGVLAAIHLPEPVGDIPNAVLHRLHEEERSYAEGLEGRRKAQWIGGRLAVRTAARSLGYDIGAVLSTARGAPIAPRPLSLSISHKERLAVALVCKKTHGSVGVDFEVLGRDRRHIAEKILSPTELEKVHALPEKHQWGAILVRFAIKEAIYKSLAPRLRRYIAFDEAVISEFQNGHAKLHLNLKGDDVPASIEGLYEWMPEGLIATVRSRWT